MIKAVIFDCFGVLTKDWWKDFCDSVPPGPGLEKAKELNHQYDSGAIKLEDFMKGVELATGRALQPVEAIVTSPQATKNTRLMDYIRILGEDYKIGMLSNIGTTWITDSFLNDEEQKLFDAMVFSFQVALTKPNPKIYQIAAQRLRVQPNECVFIDDVERYCEGARAVGMQAIHYRDFEQMKTELDKILSAGTDN